MQIKNNKKYYSLYEYLGHAGGATLGDKVNTEAIKSKQPFIQQYVSNPVFTGNVFCYTKEFLNKYFKKNKKS